MCIVCIANNINRNVYMDLNTRIFPTTGYARVVVINVNKASARRNGYRMFISVYILWDWDICQKALRVFFKMILLCPKIWHQRKE